MKINPADVAIWWGLLPIKIKEPYYSPKLSYEDIEKIYIEHTRPFEEITGEMVRAEYVKLYGEENEVSVKSCNAWLKELYKEIVFMETKDYYRVDTKTREGKLTRALLKALKVLVTPKNKLEILLILRGRLSYENN